MSATPRLYVDAPLAAGERLELDSDQSHYLTRVMRLGVNSPVRLFNGRDGEFAASLAEISKRSVVLAIGERTRTQEIAPDLWLAFTPVKKSATDLIVEKAVELGVRRLLPVRTQRCNAQSVRADRFQRIAVEAAEQSERLDVPEIAGEVSLEVLLADWPVERLLVFCDEAGDDPDAPWGGADGKAAPLGRALGDHVGRPAAILIGPEGGFAPEERQMLRSRPYVLPVSLGPRILKAETAAIAALTVWQSVCGDWGVGPRGSEEDSAPEN